MIAVNKTSIVRSAAVALAIAWAVPTLAFAQSDLVDPALQPYQPVQGVSGNLKSVGSDTMNNEMTLWAEGFLKHYPNVQIEIEGKGSSTAPPALVSGTSHFGPMSREMKGKEIDEFEKRYGYKPTALATSIDMLAVYVNKDNPIECMSLPQVDAVFSKTRRGGYEKDIRTWGELGLDGEWASMPISLYGRNAASGTYGFYKDNALFGGDYKSEVKEQPGSSSVVQGVASEKGGIGYSGIGYMTADVRAVPLAEKEGATCVAAIPENAYTGEYPLARFLYVYVNKKPGTELDPLRREFIKYIFSKDGQEDVVKDGYYPVTKVIADEQLAALDIK